MLSYRLSHRSSHRLYLAIVLLFVLPTVPAKASFEYVYLSSGNAITVFLFGEQTALLTEMQEVPLQRAGVMAISGDHNYLYAATQRGKRSEIVSFAIGNDGRLTQLNVAAAGYYPTYLSLDKSDRFLYGSHYGAGKLSVWSTVNRVFSPESAVRTLVYDLEKNAHAAVFSPDGRHLYVPATGPNKVFQFTVQSSTGALVPNARPFARGPQGGGPRQPRHISFHPTLDIAYTTLERDQPGVGIWRRNRSSGQLMFRNALSSLPRGFKGTMHTAELHLSPDGRYLYLSNRDVTRGAPAHSDSIAVFRVNSRNGDLTPVSHFPTGRIPRAFWLSQSGRYVFVANRGDNTLQLAARDNETGMLSHRTTVATGKSPVWVQSIVK